VSDTRLIAVLGYSGRSGDGLHRICAGRLRRAEQVARAGDVILLSGWARNGSAASEAAEMARAWTGERNRLVLDGRARSTIGNVSGAAALARRLDAAEVVLVTSSWHSRRAAVLLRWALRRSRSTVRLATTDERGSIGIRLRELACWTLVPFGLAAASARRREASATNRS
jgi:uncharacterized SAM-binding protein YcdF (DUF218 family)